MDSQVRYAKYIKAQFNLKFDLKPEQNCKSGPLSPPLHEQQPVTLHASTHCGHGELRTSHRLRLPGLRSLLLEFILDSRSLPTNVRLHSIPEQPRTISKQSSVSNRNEFDDWRAATATTAPTATAASASLSYVVECQRDAVRSAICHRTGSIWVQTGECARLCSGATTANVSKTTILI